MPASRERFERLLSEIIDHPERAAELTETIQRTFGEERAILVLDMSGFSRTTQRSGIISFLVLIHKMRSIARPCIEEHGGVVVKTDADNLLCVFDTVEGAVRAAQEIGERLDAANAVMAANEELHASFGIGFGTILNIADEDVFGDEVNLASKLGEDVAQNGAILVTTAAREHLGDGFRATEEAVSVSGLSLTYHRIEPA